MIGPRAWSVLRWLVVVTLVTGSLLVLVFWWRHPELTEMELLRYLIGRPA